MDDDTVPLSTKLGRDSVVRPQLLLSLRQRGLYHDGGPKPGSEVQHLLGRGQYANVFMLVGRSSAE